MAFRRSTKNELAQARKLKAHVARDLLIHITTHLHIIAFFSDHRRPAAVYLSASRHGLTVRQSKEDAGYPL